MARQTIHDQLRALGIPDDQRTRCEIWSRVMGYHRPVSSWNTGKQAEYDERTPFKEPSHG